LHEEKRRTSDIQIQEGSEITGGEKPPYHAGADLVGGQEGSSLYENFAVEEGIEKEHDPGPLEGPTSPKDARGG